LIAGLVQPGNCSKGQLVNQGSVESKLSGYFNAACFTSPPIIGADGVRKRLLRVGSIAKKGKRKNQRTKQERASYFTDAVEASE